MFYAIRQIFLKGGTIKDAIAYVFKATGKMPTKSEGMKIITVYQDVQKHSGDVIQFPKERITPFHKPRPTEAELKAKFDKQNKETAEKIRQRRYEEAVKNEERMAELDPDYIPDIIDPEDFASGGIARVGFAGGLLAKGAKWFLNSLKKNLTDLRANHPRFKGIPVEEQKMLMEGYETFIKQLEAGGEVPKEALEAISKNPQYYKTKKVTRSQDPDLAEVEELIDEKVFGHVRQELKDLETVGRKPNASGGIAGQLHLNQGGRVSFTKGGKVSSGLAHVLGV